MIQQLHKILTLQEGGRLPGPESGPCLILRNELSEETCVLTKEETLLGRGPQLQNSRVREARRTALTHGCQAWVLWC